MQTEAELNAMLFEANLQNPDWKNDLQTVRQQVQQ